MAGKPTFIPAVQFWENMLPSVAIPETLSASLSPVEGTYTADRFANAVANGGIFPAASKSFCNAAGLMCQEDISIDVYKSDAPKIETINDFQKDFFLESSLTKGHMMSLDENLHDSIPKRSFLPKTIADTLPALTTQNLPKLMQTFNIGKQTNMAKIMRTAVTLCENPALPGEQRSCPTSLESMAEFVTSQLGEHVQLFATAGAPTKAPVLKAPVTVMEFAKLPLSNGKNIVVCHNIMFPSQLYYCHFVTGTKVVQASLAAADGSIIKGVAICHLDTHMWLSRHPAFAALNIPRGAEVCHWSGEHDLVWVPNH